MVEPQSFAAISGNESEPRLVQVISMEQPASDQDLSFKTMLDRFYQRSVLPLWETDPGQKARDNH